MPNNVLHLILIIISCSQSINAAIAWQRVGKAKALPIGMPHNAPTTMRQIWRHNIDNIMHNRRFRLDGENSMCALCRLPRPLLSNNLHNTHIYSSWHAEGLHREKVNDDKHCRVDGFHRYLCMTLISVFCFARNTIISIWQWRKIESAYIYAVSLSRL